MKRVRHAAAIALVAGMTIACAQDAAQRLKLRTDIDLTGEKAKVSFLDRKDLDQVGYHIALDENGERGFLEAIEKVSGGMCREFVISGEGCHYRSKHGHDVFVSKSGSGAYQIYTSG